MFKEKSEIDAFWQTVSYGRELRLVRDLSGGRMEEDMIQELRVRVLARNKNHIYRMINSFPVLELELGPKK